MCSSMLRPTMSSLLVTPVPCAPRTAKLFLHTKGITKDTTKNLLIDFTVSFLNILSDLILCFFFEAVQSYIDEMVTNHGRDCWTCLRCGKEAKTRQHIRSHAEIHLEGATNICPYCSKNFKTSNTLQNHISLKHKDL